MTTLSTIVRILSISIAWTESACAAVRDGATFASAATFEDAIMEAARFAPSGRCYEKTQFVMTVRTNDGEATYTGRVDIDREMAAFWSLGEHIMDHTSFVLGHAADFPEQVQASQQWYAFAKVLRDAKLEIAQEEAELGAECGFARLCMD